MRTGLPFVHWVPVWLVSTSTLWIFSCVKLAGAAESQTLLQDQAEAAEQHDNSEAEELEEAEGAKLCPDLDDENGRWEGSRQINGKYTLTCAPGFKVHGRGNRSTILTCPSSLKWTEDVWCANIDDCAKLKHGCGALGVCIDLVMGYECNCERGYGAKHSRDGEIVCGSKHWNSVVCGGNTCGAYGVCIDLSGDDHSFDTVKNHEKHNGTHHEKDNKSKKTSDSMLIEGNKSKKTSDLSYRCECTDGFRDDGETCVRLECGELSDPLGVWEGSTKYGEEYTLTCPSGSYVWGGALQEVTISCPTRGSWLSKPKCISPVNQARDAEFATLRFATFVFLSLVCVCSAAAAAGLTLGVATLEPFKLNVICETDPDECAREDERERLFKDKAYAKKMRDVVKGDHRLMVTLFIFNTLANEALPIFLDQVTSALVSVLLSVSVVLIVGEILPSAICTGSNQFYIAAKSVPFVKVLEVAFAIVAKPISFLLDRYLDTADSVQKYSRQELHALFQLHVQAEVEGEQDDPHMHRQESVRSNTSEAGGHQQLLPPLSNSEMRIMDNMWELRERTLKERPTQKSPGHRYWRVAECLKAYSQDTPLDVLKESLPFKVKPRAVLVLNDELGRSDTPNWQEKPVLADLVHGILHIQQLLNGGSEPLFKLCPESQPPIIYEDSDLLEVLKELGTSCFGIVVQKTSNGRGRAEVKGVISRSELLGTLILQSRDELDRNYTSFNKNVTFAAEDQEEIFTSVNTGGRRQPVNLQCTRGARLNRAPSMQWNQAASPSKDRDRELSLLARVDVSPESYSSIASGGAGANWHDPVV